MSLPNINTPSFEYELPYSKLKIKYRPFLVKEKKILLIAKESEDFEDQERAVRDIIENCTYGVIKTTDKLAPVDLEMLFLKLRIVSKGAITKIGLKCQAQIDTPERLHPSKGKIAAYSGPCNKVNEIEIDLNKVVVHNNDKNSNTIMITDGLGIKLNMPDVSQSKNIEKANETDIMNFIIDSVDCIFDNDNVYPAQDSTKEELNEFFDQMTDTQFDKVVDFFRNLPYIKIDIKFKCEKCQHTEEKEIKGIQSLFM